MAQPTERGVWIGDRGADGQAPFWIVTSDARVLKTGSLDYDSFDHDESRAMYRYLNQHDRAIRLTA